MQEIENAVNQVVNSDKFITYVDNELFNFADSYVSKIFDENPNPKNRLSMTQARGMLNIATHNIVAHSLNKSDELKSLCSNRKSKSTNQETRDVWEQLYYLFDSANDQWKKIIALDKLTPKQFIDENIPETLTNKQKTDFKSLLNANLMYKFCIHFYSQYNYMKALKGEK